MAIQTARIEYDGFDGYRAQPERAVGPLPGVIVLQEIWGVDDHIEDVTRRFAAAGYVAVAPDLFSVKGARPEPVTKERIAEVQAWANTAPRDAIFDGAKRKAALDALDDQALAGRVHATMSSLTPALGAMDDFLPHLLATVAYLHTADPVARGQKVGAVGFCMGGGLVGRLACATTDLAAGVIFYGSPPPLDRVGQGTAPLLGLYAQSDAGIVAALPAFSEAMETAKRPFEKHIWSDANHAFFNDGRPSYAAHAARDAFVKTLAFLRDHLSR